MKLIAGLRKRHRHKEPVSLETKSWQIKKLQDMAEFFCDWKAMNKKFGLTNETTLALQQSLSVRIFRFPALSDPSLELTAVIAGLWPKLPTICVTIIGFSYVMLHKFSSDSLERPLWLVQANERWKLLHFPV